NVECRVIDAQQIDLPDAAVDAVLSRFGLMLVPERERAVAECRRVLRPGGGLAYGVWGPFDRNPWLTHLVGAMLEHGHAPPGDPHIPFDQFGHNFMREVVTTERVAATIATVVGERIEVGPMAAGPRDAARATLRGKLADVDVSLADGPEDGEAMRFTAVVRL